ncbi:MAG: hypothetical protein IOC54_02895 [Methylobacterium sp.]|nr:hypothetical protein [Methylobacterium sp.]MCA3650770.1 hypothetical protein [Methylobacterium sp.]MCA4923802.1 hypothetical protein [Methylobacterium sp.]
MRSFLDAKTIAKTLRQELQNRKIELSHSECLEVVARQFGFRDWNTMAATGTQTGAQKLDLASLPPNWELSGEHKWLFEARILKKAGPTSKNVLLLRSKPDAVVQNTEWCCVYPKAFSAEQFRGKNVEFRASVRCTDLQGVAFLWIRIEDALRERITHVGRWEVPEEEVLSGTRDWQHQSISVAVPNEAAAMYFGATLYGNGAVWLAEITFGETSAPDTRLRTDIPATPQNLDLQVA